ncbi:MAG: amidohydrolase family protein, partial [Desulfatibacillaceae bacterium]|nr:amidohydrolase family protein [Desulfatibacillaceae bacterium]
MEDSFFLCSYFIDGSGGPVQRDCILASQKGLITRILPKGAALPPKAKIWDFSGCTIVPALADSHVHLAWTDTAEPSLRKAMMNAPWQDAKRVIASNTALSLDWGVVLARDAGDRHAWALKFWLEEKSGPFVIIPAGKAWHAANRYGAIIGRPPDPGVGLHEAIAMHSKNLGHVKIVGSGINSLADFGRQSTPQFPLSVLARAVEAARALNLNVTVHANGQEPVRIALEAGAASIEHGFFMGEENLRRLARLGTAWAPTAVTMAGYARTLPPGDPRVEIAEKMLGHQIGQMEIARKLGVKICPGTDAGSQGVSHGRALWEEMGIMARAGFKVEEVIAAASRENFALAGVSQTKTLAPQNPADMVVVAQSPEKLLAGPPEIKAVFVGGRQIRPAASAQKEMGS